MISVIVPIYYVEKYLRHCLESILCQTYKNLEVIIVNDGSTDGSRTICEEFADRDTRVKVINQLNSGLSGARNAGLELASGDFISFIDGDDFIHPQMLETLRNHLKDNENDFSMIYMRQVREEEVATIEPVRPDNYEIEALSASDLFSRIYGKSDIDVQYHVVCNKLYRKALIQDIRFEKVSSEDLHFNNRVYLKVRKAVVIPERLYYYVQRGGSLAHSGVSMTFINRINTYLLCLSDIPEDEQSYRALCLSKMYKTMLFTRYHSRRTDLWKEAELAGAMAYRQTVKEYLRSNIPFAEKYGLLVFYHFPYAYSVFMGSCDLKAKSSRNGD